jgi:putative membrane protein
MTGKFGTIALLAGALACVGLPALGQSAKTDKYKASRKATETHFIADAIRGNLSEIRLGDLGKIRAASEEIRAFAATLVADHTAANEKATAAAKSAGVTPPTEETAQQTRAYQTLSKLSGATFDRRFIAHMVSDHKHDIAEYTRVAAAGGPIAEYAKQSLPTLRAHLQAAEKIEHDQAATGKSGATKKQ